MPPGWRKEWHVGVRATESRKLVAFIAATPQDLRVRGKLIKGSEVNLLCVHKKLRSKRLAPVLIKEITRRINLQGIWQAIYTGGVVLPKPVSSCRYFHRPLDWQKLYEVGFSACPANSKPQYQVRKFALPEQTAVKGLRPTRVEDVPAVHALLKKYLNRYELIPDFTQEEVEHWMVHKPEVSEEQVIFSYVVEVSLQSGHLSSPLLLPAYSLAPSPGRPHLLNNTRSPTGRKQEYHGFCLLLLARVLRHQPPAALRRACCLRPLLRYHRGTRDAIRQVGPQDPAQRPLQ